MLNFKSIFSVYFIISLVLIYLSCLNTLAAEVEILKPSEFIIPFITSPPKIDGVVNDKVWKEAVKLSLNFQIWPGDNTPPSENTFVYLGYDAKNLYVAFEAFDCEPDKIRCVLAKRDNIFEDDYVGVFLDTFNDQRRCYAFYFNPIGIQADAIRFSDGYEDFNWDTQITSKGLIDNRGYCVEVAIPFSSIKFPEPDFYTCWGLHIVRVIARRGERISWMPRKREESNWLLLEGHFYGLKHIKIGHPLEVMPVITGAKVKEEFKNNSFKLSPGVNIKLGLTSNLTLNATLNPDFSQVEADAPQIDVNLRFPLFFEEKRPFFLEGKDIFDTPFTVVHTRSIVDPDFGVKLTGKSRRNTIGILLASDASGGKLYDESDPRYKKNALFTIFRFKRDILQESEFGFIFTDRQFSNSFNRVYGIDGKFKLKQYSIIFQGLNSHTSSEEGIRTCGGAYKIDLYYLGRNFYWGTTHTYIHPDYEASAGFTERKGFRSYKGWLGYNFEPKDEKAILRQWGPSFSSFFLYDTKGTLTDRILHSEIYFSLSNQTEFGTWANSNYILYEGRDFYPFSTGIWVDTLYSEKISGGMSLYFGDAINYDTKRLLLGKNFGGNVYLNFKFSDKFRNSFSVARDALRERNTKEIIYDVSIFRDSLTYQFTRNLAFRTIIDYNSFGHRIETNFLFTWTPNPGTVFYIGYDDLMSLRERGRYESDRKMFFMKISYLFNL